MILLLYSRIDIKNIYFRIHFSKFDNNINIIRLLKIIKYFKLNKTFVINISEIIYILILIY